MVPDVAAGFWDGGGTDWTVALVGAGAGAFAGAADGLALAAAAGLCAGAGDVAGAFGAGDAAGELDAAGLVAGAGLSSVDGARLPMFAKSGPTLILPSNAGRSKI